MRKLFFAFASAFAGRARDDEELDGVAHLATGLATYVGPLCFVRRSSREALADLLAQRDEISAKCWSEWQVLNLRPPRPERGNFSPQLDRLSPAYKLHRRPQLAQQGGGVSPSRSRRNARYFSPFQILRNVSWVASPSVKAS